MLRHRLAREADHYRLPASSPKISAGSFELCPIGVLAACCPQHLTAIHQIYEKAFQSACEAVRKSPGDILFAVWN